MNVNKININQSELTYDIISDSYDITYNDSNVGEKLSELESTVGKDMPLSNSDMSIADENKYEIVHFKDGHIKTKNFDSSKDADNFNRGLMSSESYRKINNIEDGAQVNNTETIEDITSDLNISDEQDNVIASFVDGHIKTKNFDSTTFSIKESEVENVDFVVSDGKNDALVIAKGHIKTKHFSSENVYDKSQTYNKQEVDDITSRNTNSYFPYFTKDQRIYKYVHVGDGYEYQHVQDAINSCNDATIDNQYMVVIHDDIYVDSITKLRIFTDKTQSLSNDSPYNTVAAYFFTKDYVNIMGENGRQVKIEVHIPESELQAEGGSRASFVHCIYAYGTFTMKDLFIRCSNTRYAIHQENGSGTSYGQDSNRYKEYINIKLEYLSGKNYNVAMGVGVAPNLRVLIDNCTFISHVYGGIGHMHTHPNYEYPYEYVIRNSRIIGLNGNGTDQGFQDLCSGKRHKVTMEGCVLSSLNPLYGVYGNFSISDNCHDIRNSGVEFSGHNNYACMGIVSLPVLVLKSSSLDANIQVDKKSSACKYIFGDIYKSYKGMVVGTEYLPYSTQYKGLNMGTRLGDCSAANKVLTVTVNLVSHNIIFNKNYTSLSNEAIINEMNSSLVSAGIDLVVSDTFNEKRLYFNDDVVFVKNNSDTPINIDDFVTLSDSGCVSIQTGNQRVFGIAAERIDPEEYGYIIKKGKQKFNLFRGLEPERFGLMYKVENNTLEETQSESDAVMICTNRTGNAFELEWIDNV